MLNSLKLLISLFVVVIVLSYGIKVFVSSDLTLNNPIVSEFHELEMTSSVSKKILNNFEEFSDNDSTKKAVKTVSDTVGRFNETMDYVFNMENHLNNPQMDEKKNKAENTVNSEKTNEISSFEVENDNIHLENSKGIFIEVNLK
ncbi:conserved hypothetical protein [Methanococcus vannielii SB]|uniref:Uncharacterized protein n=1 Tax=Methanococcus vannielii (strain ATCC 35089 / DSM 1224 / JCM 13029 / OCM 148 / SB) TaxID=406327 RepID=A6UNX9_METVS|nr:hypothetical protein [Methanococcus vannielii]ABR54201.1 conserved hypothetical protein [Methanococcus vannielii SB]